MVRSCRWRVLAWDTLALALAAWVSRIMRAALVSRMDRSGGLSGRASSSALVASRTWQIVTSGFFFPQPLRLAGEEQVTDLRDAQVPEHGDIFTHLEVAQPQFTFFILQGPFHRPA